MATKGKVPNSSTADSYVCKVAVLTVSDRCSRGESEDRSGPNLKKLVENSEKLSPAEVVLQECVPDEAEQIKALLVEWSDGGGADLVLTTGGTGFGARDVTPEATKAVIERECPGMVIAMMTDSLKITPLAMLSRPACGIRRQTLILNFPGSAKASEECFRSVEPALRHAVDLLRGDLGQVELAHQQLQREEGRQDGPAAQLQQSEEPHHLTKPGHHHHLLHHHHHHHHHHQSAQEPSVAQRPRHSPYPMLTFDQAMTLVLDQAGPVLPKCQVLCQDALGHVLADHVEAEHAIPPFPASIKDGYAVIASDGAGDRTVVAATVAGQSAARTALASGQTVRVTTGAPIPPGADAVVQVEDTQLVEASQDGAEESRVKILVQPRPALDIRPLGSDVAKGQRVLSQGMVLGPSELGLLASVGLGQVKVHAKPVVAVLSTGNELQDAGQELRSGHIFDANRIALLASLHQHHFQAHDMGIAPDRVEALREVLEASLLKADVVVTSGGVSMGEKDYLKHVLTHHLKATVHFGRVFLKPGKPTTFATLEKDGAKKLFFALPGNPVSAVVTFNLFVLPALYKLAGRPEPRLTRVRARTVTKLRLDPRPEFQRVHLDWGGGPAGNHGDGGGLPLATSTGKQQSSRLLSMCRADALLCLPPRSEVVDSLPEGSVLDALLI